MPGDKGVIREMQWTYTHKMELLSYKKDKLLICRNMRRNEEDGAEQSQSEEETQLLNGLTHVEYKERKGQ